MAKKVTKSGLAAKIKGNVVAAHATDDTLYGFMDLPGGVSGIAQLVDCKFDQYKTGDNTGEYYFYAAGVLVEVDSPSHKHLIGQRTSIMEPMCDTPRRKRVTPDDHAAWVLNEMRKLGYDTASMRDNDDLEPAAAALLEAQPYFRFSTSGGRPTKDDPEPRIWHNWHGNQGLGDYAPSDDGTAVDDSTSTDEESDETDDSATADAADEEQSLAALASDADGDDADAQRRLTEVALKAGVTKKAIDEASSWAEVAGMIESSEGEESSDSEDDGPTIPKAGEVYDFKPPKQKKAVTCEILSVNEKAGTVNLKNCDDESVTYKGIRFSALIGYST